ncbi:hypothetical protein QSV34_07695 [Porticoccus sp. W117]|uniref:hypothetical protein n=1 Tax=Porticoccus sp. W117 TaxID=3054777 RepID=UPI0025968E6C|nr:hypothetical protein [Porticoccus sp. W117]MDM3871237.1 hypothetical protein [Porticoccus sp. W117]
MEYQQREACARSYAVSYELLLARLVCKQPGFHAYKLAKVEWVDSRINWSESLMFQCPIRFDVVVLPIFGLEATGVVRKCTENWWRLIERHINAKLDFNHGLTY